LVKEKGGGTPRKKERRERFELARRIVTVQWDIANITTKQQLKEEIRRIRARVERRKRLMKVKK